MSANTSTLSHLPPHLRLAHSNSGNAIFSPSVARAAASTAKDWSYVDSWLATKYHPRQPPAFERNADTLAALLVSAAHNEAADEERGQIARAETEALRELHDFELEQRKRGQGKGDRPQDGSVLPEAILSAISSHLSPEAQAAVSSMSTMAVALSIPYPTPAKLAASFASLSAQALSLSDTISRASLLRDHLTRETESLNTLITTLSDDTTLSSPPDLARLNLDLQRRLKSLSSRLPDLQAQLSANSINPTSSTTITSSPASYSPLPSTFPLPISTDEQQPGLTVEEVRVDEEAYLEVLGHKKALDAQLKAFAGLPPDVEAARAELESLRAELRHATETRDAVFEGLVERESPVKVRGRRQKGSGSGSGSGV